MFEYDFFVLPTIGENFGYVFLEALAAGCPLITSDRTPWTTLRKTHWLGYFIGRT
jgi:glycosyltransferase involved in cell wall biosynthesis